MALTIVMPKLGLTMTDGEISKWYKSEGDPVKKGEIIYDVETDKITNQVEAERDGFIKKILVGEGVVALVKDPVAIIGDEDEDISDLLGVSAGTKVEEIIEAEIKVEVQEESKVIVNNTGYIRATPLAKKVAKENGIELAHVAGTGFEGRVLEKDILKAIESKVRDAKISPTAAKMAKEQDIDINSINSDRRIMKDDILNYNNKGELVEDTRVPLSSMRKVIAKRMSESWTTSPRVTYNNEIDMTEIKRLRNSLKNEFVKQGSKLSYNHILMKVIATALTEFPYINASLDGTEIVLHKNVNIGLAVDVEAGLVVPNLKDAQNKSLLQIAKGTEMLIDDARNNKLATSDMRGGTFTISNLGMFGVDTFSPIINQPELAILGIDRMIDKPIVINGEIVIRPMMKLSLTADHRVIDGAMAAKFLARVREILENPFMLLV
ncbi:dihydrolipoamide acetyltransferase family protein [Clostridium sp. DL1XJH146]